MLIVCFLAFLLALSNVFGAKAADYVNKSDVENAKKIFIYEVPKKVQTDNKKKTNDGNKAKNNSKQGSKNSQDGHKNNNSVNKKEEDKNNKQRSLYILRRKIKYIVFCLYIYSTVSTICKGVNANSMQLRIYCMRCIS